MRNDDVIAEWWLIIFGQWWYQVLRHINIHLLLNSQPSITYNGRVVVAKLKFLIIKKVTMTSQFRDESTFSSEVRTYWSHSQKTPTCQKSAFCDWQFLQSIRYRDIYIYTHINRVLIVRTSALRLLALRGWRTLRVRMSRPSGASLPNLM